MTFFAYTCTCIWLIIIFGCCIFRLIKGSGTDPKLCFISNFSSADKVCHSFKGLHFIPFMKKPWTMAYSRSNKRKYFYNIETKASVFESNNQAFAPLEFSLRHRILFVEPGTATRQGLENMRLDVDEWIKAIAPWVAG